jgi:hypothetical protein
MEWQANSEEKSRWSCFFYESYLGGKILDVEPIGFEQGEDRIDIGYKEIKKGNLTLESMFTWESMSEAGDIDGITLTGKYPSDNQAFINVNGQMLHFSKRDLFEKGSLLFNEKNGLGGTLIIKNAYVANVSRELFALREMVLGGKGDYRFSAPLQAMLWGYMDGKFKEGDDPFDDRTNVLDFVIPIWADMKSPRWEDFDKVTLRLNLPELIDYYERKRITWVDWRTLPTWPVTPYYVFKHNKGGCVSITRFTVHCLRKGGYKAWELRVGDISGRYPFHAVCLFEMQGEKYIMNNGTSWPLGISPFDLYRKRLQ